MNEGAAGRRGEERISYDNGRIMDRTLALRDCYHFFARAMDYSVRCFACFSEPACNIID